MILNVPLLRILPNPWQTRQGAPDAEYLSEKRRAQRMMECVRQVVATRMAQALEMREALAWRMFAHHRLTGYSDRMDQTERLKSFVDIAYRFGELAAESIMAFEPVSIAALLGTVNNQLQRAGLATISEDEMADWEEGQA